MTDSDVSNFFKSHGSGVSQNQDQNSYSFPSLSHSFFGERTSFEPPVIADETDETKSQVDGPTVSSSFSSSFSSSQSSPSSSYASSASPYSYSIVPSWADASQNNTFNSSTTTTGTPFTLYSDTPPSSPTGAFGSGPGNGPGGAGGSLFDFGTSNSSLFPSFQQNPQTTQLSTPPPQNYQSISTVPLPLPQRENQDASSSGSKTFTQETETFEIRKMHRNTAMAFIGGIRSGKSKLITYVLQVMRFRRVVAFLGGSDAAEWYRFFIPDIYIHEYARKEFDSNLVFAIIKHQDIVNGIKTNFKEDMAHTSLELCLLFEDLAFDDLFRTDDNIKQLVSNTRRLNMTSIFSAQYANSFATKIRGNFEYSFLFRIEDQPSQRFCHSMFGEGFSLDVFRRIWMDITSVKHACMVLTRNCEDPKKKICKILAPVPPDEKKVEMKTDYVVDLQSVIFHHIFWKPNLTDNAWLPVYGSVFGKNTFDPAFQEKDQASKPKEVVHDLGRHGIVVHRTMPPNPELNKIEKTQEKLVPMSLLPRPPAPLTQPVPYSSQQQQQQQQSTISTIPLPVPSSVRSNFLW